MNSENIKIVGFLKALNRDFTGFLRPIYFSEKHYFAQDVNLNNDNPKNIKAIPENLLKKEYYQSFNDIKRTQIIKDKHKPNYYKKGVFVFQLSFPKGNKTWLVGVREFIINELEKLFFYEYFFNPLKLHVKYEIALFLSFSQKAMDYKKEIEYTKGIKIDSPFKRMKKKHLEESNVVFVYLRHLLSERKSTINNYLIAKNEVDLKKCISVKEKDILIGFYKIEKRFFSDFLMKRKEVLKLLNNSYSVSVYILLLYHTGLSFLDILSILNKNTQFEHYHYNNYLNELNELLYKEDQIHHFKKYLEDKCLINEKEFQFIRYHVVIDAEEGFASIENDYKDKPNLKILVD